MVVEIHNTRLLKVNNPKIVGICAKCDAAVIKNKYHILTNKGDPIFIFLAMNFAEESVPLFFNNVLPTLRTPFKLIVASGDATFPAGTEHYIEWCTFELRQKIDKLLNSDMLLRCYVENLDTLHPKLTPIPCGLLMYNTPDIKRAEEYVKYLEPHKYKLPPMIPLHERTTRVFCCNRVRYNNKGEVRQNADRIKVQKNDTNCVVEIYHML